MFATRRMVYVSADGLELVGRVVSWKHPSYGFLRCTGGVVDLSRDVFVHINDVVDRERLPVGARVRFRVEQTDRGPRAVDVAPMEWVR